MAAHRKSIARLKLTGGYRPGRHDGRTDLPPCPEGIGRPPTHLSVAQKNIWYEIVSQLAEGHLQSGDRMLLELVVSLVAKQRNRRVRITKGEQALLLTSLVKMGLSPVDRNRVTIPPKKDEAALAEWEDF
jgi:hypothetical protein